MANSKISQRAEQSPTQAPADRQPPSGGAPNRLVFTGIMAAANAVVVALLVIFPDVALEPGFLALVVLTPLLAGVSFALSRSGFRRRLPRPAAWTLRGALLLVVALDLLVFALPVVTSGRTAHDDRPVFTGASTAPLSATATPAPGPLTGQFIGRPGPETATGNATLGRTTNGTLVLRLENFHSANSPNVLVYLSTYASPNTRDQVISGFMVGKLTATSGEQNYTLPSTLDIAQYKSAVIYCRAFNAIFGYANLHP